MTKKQYIRSNKVAFPLIMVTCAFVIMIIVGLVLRFVGMNVRDTVDTDLAFVGSMTIVICCLGSIKAIDLLRKYSQYSQESKSSVLLMGRTFLQI